MMRLNNSFLAAPFSNQPLSLLVRSSAVDKQKKRWGFAQPFEPDMWLSIVLAIILAGIYFVIIEGGKSASQDFEGRAFNSVRSFITALGVSVFYAFSSLTGMDAWTPVTLSGKMFQMVWTFYCLVTIAAYTAASAA